MRRRAFFILSALSFSLFLATGILGLRSYFVWDGFSRAEATRREDVSLVDGLLWNRVETAEYPRFEVGPSAGEETDAEEVADKVNPPAAAKAHWTHYTLGINPAGDALPDRPFLGFYWGPQLELTRTYHFGNGPVSVPHSTSYLRVRAFPLWPILTLAAIAPAVHLRSILRRRRHRARAQAGQCSHCGYDLRGSRERCPECGAEVESRTGLLPPTGLLGRD